MPNHGSKFRGGAWIGFLGVTWPFGVLEVDENQLAIIDQSSKRERRFAHAGVERIKVLKVFPIIGYGIQIYPRDKSEETPLIFWFTFFRYKKLMGVLKECGWLA